MMQNKLAWSVRFRYAMDRLFSQGTFALIGILALTALFIVLISASILTISGFSPSGQEGSNFIEAAWEMLVQLLTTSAIVGRVNWGFRGVLLSVTLAGVLVTSTLVGLLSSCIFRQFENLRKGRCRVVEKGHTVILGWSEQVHIIISELVIPNENQKRSCLVVLANRDKVEMEDDIRGKVGDLGRTRLVCRTGDPMEMADLALVSPNTAKAIIVVSPDKDDPDSEVIKTVLAITNHPERRAEPYHIVAELRDPKNMDAARIVGKGEVEWVLVGDLVARVIAQTCRQSGRSIVYTELLDYGGDEIYFTQEPALVGKPFGEALLSYEKNAVLGLCPAGGAPQLNPPMDTVIQKGDELIVVAEDDDKIIYGRPGAVDAQAIVSGQPAAARPERTLILGWNWRGPAILNELFQYVTPGSTAKVVADTDTVPAELQRFCAAQCDAIAFQHADTTDRRVHDRLGLEQYDHIILLCYSNLLGPQQADARTLITLLHLRDIAEIKHTHFAIVSEMLDIRNRNLAEVTRADDFIVSDRFISLILAQVSENKRLNAVFQDMFDPEGSEIYLKPAGQYVRLGQPVNFYTVVEAARQRGEVAFGYRLQRHAGNAERMYGVAINPAKSDQVAFAEEDKIIVLAES